MKTINLKYRIKLNSNLVLENPLFSLLSGKYSRNSVDFQIFSEDGNIIQDYSNQNLCAENSYEGSTTMIFDHNINDNRLNYYIFNGACSFTYESDIANVYQIQDYFLYESKQDNTFYCTKKDLNKFSSNYDKELESVWEDFLWQYSAYWDILAINVDVLFMSISDDQKVCKIKTQGFNRIDEIINNDQNNLTRNMPS